MADDTTMTLIGNLTADPELRYTPSGASVANFTIANTPRYFDKRTSEWTDQETLFVRCSLWREAAENSTESLRKGMRVIAQGRLKARSFEDREGNQRTVWELEVDEIGPSLKKAIAQVHKTTGQAQQAQSQPGGFAGAQAQSDPWSQPQPQTQGGWGQPQTAQRDWDTPPDGAPF